MRDNIQYRNICKAKLMTGIYSPWEFLDSISRSLTNTISLDDYSIINLSDESGVGEEEPEQLKNLSSCVVCLGNREDIWIFLQCKHGNCCKLCTQTIRQMGNTCPACRNPMDTFQIFYTKQYEFISIESKSYISFSILIFFSS